eukprot:SAG31_NODE_2938_length_4883_cov_21.311521_5_plen_159_part_00
MARSASALMQLIRLLHVRVNVNQAALAQKASMAQFGTSLGPVLGEDSDEEEEDEIPPCRKEVLPLLPVSFRVSLVGYWLLLSFGHKHLQSHSHKSCIKGIDDHVGGKTARNHYCPSLLCVWCVHNRAKAFINCRTSEVLEPLSKSCEHWRRGADRRYH